jgi:hypothetical protein
VLADARATAGLALASNAVVLADARATAGLALASNAVVLADARATAGLALASLAVVLADARATAELAPASNAVVLTDALARALQAQALSAAPSFPHTFVVLRITAEKALTKTPTMCLIRTWRKEKPSLCTQTQSCLNKSNPSRNITLN